MSGAGAGTRVLDILAGGATCTQTEMLCSHPTPCSPTRFPERERTMRAPKSKSPACKRRPSDSKAHSLCHQMESPPKPLQASAFFLFLWHTSPELSEENPTWLEINKDSWAQNLKVIEAILGGPSRSPGGQELQASPGFPIVLCIGFTFRNSPHHSLLPAPTCTLDHVWGVC